MRIGQTGGKKKNPSWDGLDGQQAAQSWVEVDPTVQFGKLHALKHHKDISTEYGLNLTVQHDWCFGDSHKKTVLADRHDYDIKISDGRARAPMAQFIGKSGR